MEIIPKPSKKSSFWLNILFYCSISIFLTLIAFYFVLGHWSKNLEMTIQRLERTLLQEKTPMEIALEQEVFASQKKINDFSRLIEGRVSAVNFFNFLEGICHPQVWLTGIKLEPEIAQAKVSGRAESFSVLSQQLLIFKEELLIEKANLSEIKISKEGGVDFEIELFLSPQVFQFKEHNYNE